MSLKWYLVDQLEIYTMDRQDERIQTQLICEQIARCLPDQFCKCCANARCLRTLPYTCFMISPSTGLRSLHCIWCESYRKRVTEYFRNKVAYVEPMDLILPGYRSDIHDLTWYQWEDELVLLRRQYDELASIAINDIIINVPVPVVVTVTDTPAASASGSASGSASVTPIPATRAADHDSKQQVYQTSLEWMTP